MFNEWMDDDDVAFFLGDHAAFQELVTDLEIIRDQTIESALCFENYQMTMTKQDLDLDVMLIEEEFKVKEKNI